MSEGQVELTLKLDAGFGMDKEELESATIRLRNELLDLDVEKVELLKAGDVPEGAKGDPVSWGTLLLTLAASGGVITTLINSAQAWLTRNDRKSITLEINGDKLDIKGVSTDEQTRLINEWLSRNSDREIKGD
ncbi:MAG: hypothetical protein GY777_27550 [Candidatus Brocadiaceae bacterium]|nr:hypothetical protein [Candidatus Brocadiaceae bacterium]